MTKEEFIIRLQRATQNVERLVEKVSELVAAFEPAVGVFDKFRERVVSFADDLEARDNEESCINCGGSVPPELRRNDPFCDDACAIEYAEYVKKNEDTPPAER